METVALDFDALLYDCKWNKSFKDHAVIVALDVAVIKNVVTFRDFGIIVMGNDGVFMFGENLLRAD